jgi:uncharacterized membrane protein YczE
VTQVVQRDSDLGLRILAPVAKSHRTSRVVLLFSGLGLYGFSDGLLVRANVGLDPWDVLHQGLSRTLGLQVGTWSIIIGAIVLLMWVPLHQRPGVGTVCNIFVVGLAINLTLALFPAPNGLVVRYFLMVVAVGLNGVATGAYIGAGMGPGPRDGLSTGIASRGFSMRLVRTSIELSVLALGWLLGGNVGIGTVVYALCIGPISHLMIPALRLSEETSGSRMASRRHRRV